MTECTLNALAFLFTFDFDLYMSKVHKNNLVQFRVSIHRSIFNLFKMAAKYGSTILNHLQTRNRYFFFENLFGQTYVFGYEDFIFGSYFEIQGRFLGQIL